MSVKNALILSCLALVVVLSSCEDKLTTLTERYTHELNGNFKFKKKMWVAGEQKAPIDTAFDIVVLHDSLIKIGSVELPLVHNGLSYNGTAVWADNLHYMLFGHDDTSGMVVVKYFYGTSTLDIEDLSANTTIKYQHIK